MSDLHTAITLDQPEVVRSICQSQDLCDIHEIDKNGDQPAHIAARLNHVECIIILMEYDARFGRKNFSGRTPLGEARMNGNADIVQLIKDNYTINVQQEHVWHAEVEKEVAGWRESYDTVEQKVQWHRRKPNGELEISATPPPIEYQRVIHARDTLGERSIVRRIHPKSLISMQQLSYERQHQLEKEKIAQMLKDRSRLVEERCATKLQAHWRKLKAIQMAAYRLEEQVAANRIQRRYRYFMTRKKQACATLIQSVIRMVLTISYYKSYNHERLWCYRASRTLALSTQSLWRGFIARARYRQLYAEHTLPDPNDARNFDYWKICQYNSHPPKKELGIFAEYTLNGTPQTWQKRQEKRDGIYYRDTIFYANTITKKASWTKPKGWLFEDHQEYYVLRVQTFYRARVAKRKIRLYTKAKLLLENAYSQDLDKIQQANDIVCLCNYTLYVHCVLHSYDEARGLYVKMIDYMTSKGVDNAFVLYSYAIFGSVTGEEDWMEIKEYTRRAKLADERLQMRRRKDTTDARDLLEKRSAYHIATAAFYLQPICNDHEPAESWHNYALCQMLVHHDLAGAKESFIQAMSYAPRDKRIISNFNTLLQDEDYMNDNTSNAYEKYLQWRDKK